MARCEATTRSGERCKLDAREGSRFCHLHAGLEEEVGTESPEDASEEQGGTEWALEWEDVAPLLMAGAMVAGIFVFRRFLGRWLP